MAIFKFLWRLRSLALWSLIFAAGWIAGDRYGLPDTLRQTIYSVLGQAAKSGDEAIHASEDYIRARLEEARDYDFDFELPSLPDDVSEEDLRVATREDSPAPERTVEPKPEPSPEPATTVQTPPAARAAGLQTAMKLCPRMDISNAPRADNERNVQGVPERITVNGAKLRTAPVTEGCFSSGFGPRSGKIHKGIDLHHPTGSDVIAAAAGNVLEATYRDDYGNFVIIDHGNGVYTRYAHLANFGRGIRAGGQVADGQRLGKMGNTASYRVPIHLHYEVLVGDYNTPKKSFGLKPVNPLTGK